MTTTFQTNPTYGTIPTNGYGTTPSPIGGVPFNGFTPAPFAGTTTGYAFQGTPFIGCSTPTFNTPGFTPTQYFPTNWPQQWQGTQQWAQFGNGNWNPSGFRGFTGFVPPSFNGFGYPTFNTFPSFNGYPAFNNWNGWTNGYTQGSFPQNGFTPGFVNPYSTIDPSIYSNWFNTFGGFPAFGSQPSFNSPINSFYQPTPYGYGFNTPFNFNQNSGFGTGFGTPTFGSFPWTPGYTQPYSATGFPFNHGQFNYGPFNGAYPTPFNGQYTNGQYMNGVTQTGSTIPGTCNGIGFNREAA